MNRRKMDGQTNTNNFVSKALLSFKFINGLAGLYLLWVFIHFIAAQLYVYYCAPLTILGFIMSPFMVATPHCHAIRWCITNGANNITTMWVTFGTWVASKLALTISGNRA